MRGARWVLLFYAHAIVTASNPRSVNLALKTTFEFNEKKDVEFINNFRQFLDKIGNNVERKLIARERPTDYSFTDFLQELISILISYDDRDFREVFKELYHMANDQRNGGAELNELLSDALRPAMLEAIKRGFATPAHTQKERLKRLSFVLNKTDKSHASFVNFLNLLYKGKPSAAFHRILKGFKTLRQRPGDANLRELVRDTVEYLVYEHYAGLDDSVKRDVGKWLRTMLKRDASLEYKQSLKKSTRTPSKPSRFTFITLYPEAIDINVTPSRIKQSSFAAWKKLTVSSQNRFYLVKGKRRTFTGNTSNQEPEESSSLEIATTVRKQPTSAHPKLSPHNGATRGKSYQRGINDKDQFNRKNQTQCNDSIPTDYLNRIKHLEEQLNEMKDELRARISTTESTSQPAQIQDESDYTLEDDPFGSEVRNSSESIEDKVKNVTVVEAEYKRSVQKRFRTAPGNQSDTVALGNGPLSREIKEFLKKQPRILNFKASNTTGQVLPVNDTFTNPHSSTKELEELAVAGTGGTTKIATVATKDVTVNANVETQRDNFTMLTEEIISSTDRTTFVKVANDTILEDVNPVR